MAGFGAPISGRFCAPDDRWGKRDLLGYRAGPVIMSTRSKIAWAAVFLWMSAAILFWRLAPQWLWMAIGVATILLMMVGSIRDQRAMKKGDVPEKGRQ